MVVSVALAAQQVTLDSPLPCSLRGTTPNRRRARTITASAVARRDIGRVNSWPVSAEGRLGGDTDKRTPGVPATDSAS